MNEQLVFFILTLAAGFMLGVNTIFIIYKNRWIKLEEEIEHYKELNKKVQNLKSTNKKNINLDVIRHKKIVIEIIQSMRENVITDQILKTIYNMLLLEDGDV